MDKLLIEYSPIILFFLIFIFKNRLVATPEQLKDLRSEILKEVDNKFSTKEAVNELKEDIRRVEEKIDNIQMLILEKLNS